MIIASDKKLFQVLRGKGIIHSTEKCRNVVEGVCKVMNVFHK